MSWIATGSIEHIHGIHDMDRPRGLGALVLLAELLLVYWFSAPLVASTAGGLTAGWSAVHPVTITPVVLLPLPPLDEASPDVSLSDRKEFPKESDGVGKATAPSSSGAESGDTTVLDGTENPDDVRIVSLSPSYLNPIWVGDVVNIEVNVEYNLTSTDSKLLTLDIQEGDLRGCNCGHLDTVATPFDKRDQPRFWTTTSTVVQKGRRRLTLTKRLRVPVAEGLYISVRLARNDADWERYDSRFYWINDPGRPASGRQGTVRITSIQPNEGSAIRAGDVVDFEVVVDYNLVSALGTLRLKIGAGNASPFVEFPENVKYGQRRMVFRERVQIPISDPGSADTIQVRAQLDETDSNGAAVHSATDTKKYELSR